MKPYIALSWALLGAACVGHSPDASFYTFVPDSNCATHDGGECVTQDTRPITVDVARVRVAEYIDRTQMVTTNGVNVYVSQDNRWAEGLAPMTQRQIISDLTTRLPSASVKDANFAGSGGDYGVFVEIYPLDGALGGLARLRASYAIASDGVAPRPRTVNYTTHVGDTYADYAMAVGRMVDKMAAEIAADIAATAK